MSLTSIPPWGVAYDVWAMGPPADVIHGSQWMHACMVVSIPLLARYLECRADGNAAGAATEPDGISHVTQKLLR
eukprot:2022914-Alexandrium_andersonii.AAC.1